MATMNTTDSSTVLWIRLQIHDDDDKMTTMITAEVLNRTGKIRQQQIRTQRQWLQLQIEQPLQDDDDSNAMAMATAAD